MKLKFIFLEKVKNLNMKNPVDLFVWTGYEYNYFWQKREKIWTEKNVFKYRISVSKAMQLSITYTRTILKSMYLFNEVAFAIFDFRSIFPLPLQFR